MHENTAHLVNLRQGVCERLQQDGDNNMVIFVSNVRPSIVVVNTKSASPRPPVPTLFFPEAVQTLLLQ